MFHHVDGNLCHKIRRLSTFDLFREEPEPPHTYVIVSGPHTLSTIMGADIISTHASHLSFNKRIFVE